VESSLLKLAVTGFSVLFLASCATAPPAPPAARAELAPTGKLRVGINRENVLLATHDPATGRLRGVAPDLARELGRRLARSIEWVPYDSAGKMAEAVKTGAWDVAFLASDPARGNEIAFSPAYLEITGVPQSIGTPKGREAGARYLREFVENVKARGMVAEAIARHRVPGVAVAP
jgi:polar amino acid transport system substrate-binding protein